MKIGNKITYFQNNMYFKTKNDLYQISKFHIRTI